MQYAIKHVLFPKINCPNFVRIFLYPGNVQIISFFSVTLAESKLVWWKNIKSEPLTFDSGATPSSTTTTTTQGTTDNSAQSSTSVSVMPGSSTMNEVTSSTTTKRILKPTRGTSSAVTWCNLLSFHFPLYLSLP